MSLLGVQHRSDGVLAGGLRPFIWLLVGLAAGSMALSCGGGGSTASPATPTPAPERQSTPAVREATATAPARGSATPPTATPTTATPPAAQQPVESPSPTPPPRAAATRETSAGLEVTPEPLSEMALQVAFPELSFIQPVYLTYPDDGTNRLFVVFQHGLLRVFENHRDVADAKTFIDIRPQVSTRGNEEGLLGLAFDPQFATNGYFYVYYSAARPRRSVVSRFSVSAEDPDKADPESELVILEVPQPFSNHNGGQIVFGPDGYLYVGLGDGGAGGDPDGNGQNTSTLLGSILRIDVTAASTDRGYTIPPDNPLVDRACARKEIWAYGLRNPWRFSFDRNTGELWAGDVGQNRFEEVDLIKPGLNYGWNVMEGLHCFEQRGCDQQGLEPPVIEYPLRPECAVTGGYVYRGARLPSLYGAYVYADFCTGKVWALRYDGESVTEHMQIARGPSQVSSFGEDSSGELYVVSFDGNVYRFVAE